MAGLVAPHLTPENAQDVLRQSKGKTKRQVEELLVSLRPRPVVTSGIRKQPERLVSRKLANVADPPAAASRGEEVVATRPVEPPPGKIEPARPEVFNFRFAAGKDFRDKLERLGEVLGVHNTQRDLAALLEKAVAIALEHKDPQKKLARRDNRAKRASSPRPAEVTAERSRYIPSAVSERLLARAGYRCEYRASDGTRCEQRTGLQIDHREPHARGGSRIESNLRVLCGPHNLWRAERSFGVQFVRDKILRARGALRSSPAQQPGWTRPD